MLLRVVYFWGTSLLPCFPQAGRLLHPRGPTLTREPVGVWLAGRDGVGAGQGPGPAQLHVQEGGPDSTPGFLSSYPHSEQCCTMPPPSPPSSNKRAHFGFHMRAECLR